MKKFRFEDLALTGFFSSLLVNRRTHRLPAKPTTATTAISTLKVNLMWNPAGVKTYCLGGLIAVSEVSLTAPVRLAALEF